MTANTDLEHDPVMLSRVAKAENDVREIRALVQELLAQLRAERNAEATA